MRWLVVALALLATPGPSSAAEQITIHVTSNGWHSGIVVPRAALPPGRIPEADDFPGAPFLEFAWGDADYYPARDPGVGSALRAALISSAAVVHLAGLPSPPREVFPTAEIVALRLAPEGFAALIEYLHAAFAREGRVRTPPAAGGLYPFSRFYPATGRFSMFNTCNTWSARGMAAAGLGVRWDGVQRAESLMEQLRPLAVRP